MYKGWMFDPRGWVESNSHCEKFVCWELNAVYLHRVQCRTAPSLYSIFPPLLLLLPCFTSSLNPPSLLHVLPPSPPSLPSFPLFPYHSKQSLTTKVWALLVKFVTGPFQPLLLSYQRSLPTLPVPRLEDTCRRVRMIVYYTSYCWHGNSYYWPMRMSFLGNRIMGKIVRMFFHNMIGWLKFHNYIARSHKDCWKLPGEARWKVVSLQCLHQCQT